MSSNVLYAIITFVIFTLSCNSTTSTLRDDNSMYVRIWSVEKEGRIDVYVDTVSSLNKVPFEKMELNLDSFQKATGIFQTSTQPIVYLSKRDTILCSFVFQKRNIDTIISLRLILSDGQTMNRNVSLDNEFGITKLHFNHGNKLNLCYILKYESDKLVETVYLPLVSPFYGESLTKIIE